MRSTTIHRDRKHLMKTLASVFVAMAVAIRPSFASVLGAARASRDDLVHNAAGDLDPTYGATTQPRVRDAGILSGRMFVNSFTRLRLIGSLALILFLAQVSLGYSPLTHEAIIDSVWDCSIKPALLQRFPTASESDLRGARAYAYGGCLIQDMGYCPFSNKFFSDLVHYVRSGDFIEALIQESHDIREYSFALGALSHYAADNDGHSIAVNHAVPIVYPRLRAKYGSEITYGDDPTSHARIEFAFDVLQVARGSYAPQMYHNSIGFKVAKLPLERAFRDTYGIEMKDIFVNVDLAIGSYRLFVGAMFPLAARIAWEMRKDEMKRLTLENGSNKSAYDSLQAACRQNWGTSLSRPGILAKTLAILFGIVPKGGPLKVLAFKPLTPEAERMFLESFTAAVDHYRALLDDARSNQLVLQNTDFDTGRLTQAGEYKLADETYSELLGKLGNHHLDSVATKLRQNILTFYADISAMRKDKAERREISRMLSELQRVGTSK